MSVHEGLHNRGRYGFFGEVSFSILSFAFFDRLLFFDSCGFIMIPPLMMSGIKRTLFNNVVLATN